MGRGRKKSSGSSGSDFDRLSQSSQESDESYERISNVSAPAEDQEDFQEAGYDEKMTALETELANAKLEIESLKQEQAAKLAKMEANMLTLLVLVIMTIAVAVTVGACHKRDSAECITDLEEVEEYNAMLNLNNDLQRKVAVLEKIVPKLQKDLDSAKSDLKNERNSANQWEKEFKNSKGYYKKEIETMKFYYRWKGENTTLALNECRSQLEQSKLAISSRIDDAKANCLQKQIEEMDSLKRDTEKTIKELKRRHKEESDGIIIFYQGEIEKLTGKSTTAPKKRIDLAPTLGMPKLFLLVSAVMVGFFLIFGLLFLLDQNHRERFQAAEAERYKEAARRDEIHKILVEKENEKIEEELYEEVMLAHYKQQMEEEKRKKEEEKPTGESEVETVIGTINDADCTGKLQECDSAESKVDTNAAKEDEEEKGPEAMNMTDLEMHVALNSIELKQMQLRLEMLEKSVHTQRLTKTTEI